MALMDKLQIVTESGGESGEEFEQDYQQDPEPGTPAPKKPSRRRSSATRKAAPTRRTPTVTKLAKEVAEDLTTLIQGAAAVWGMQDECCAPILEQQAKPIAQAFTSILSRNPRLLEKFASTDIVSYTLQSVALGKALLPVGQAIYHNHVSKAVEEGHDESGNGAIHLDQFPAFNGIDRSGQQPA